MVRNNLSLFDNFNQLTPFAVGFERHFNRLNDYVEQNQVIKVMMNLLYIEESRIENSTESLHLLKM
jgi:hypothetical protein